MGLTRPVVGVLAQDEDLQIGVRREVEGGEDLVWRGVDHRPQALGADERLQFLPVGLVELGA